jgi:hypothetical protein
MTERPNGRYLIPFKLGDKKIWSSDENSKLYLDTDKMKSHFLKKMAYRETMRDFFVNEGLLLVEEKIKDMKPDDIEIFYTDFTDEGWLFLKSLAVEKWLGSCDRKGTIEGYRNYSALKKRLDKFRTT